MLDFYRTFPSLKGHLSSKTGHTAVSFFASKCHLFDISCKEIKFSCSVSIQWSVLRKFCVQVSES